MSVKNIRKDKQNSTVRQFHEFNLNLLQNNKEVINYVDNKLQFHKKFIQLFGIHLICICSKFQCKSPKNKIGLIKNVRNGQQQLNDQYSFQIQGMNFHIARYQVKHTFPLQKYLVQNGEYIRFQLPQQQKFEIKSCHFSQQKIITKIIFVSQPGRIIKNQINCTIIKPIQLIQEKKRLRVEKLSKSVFSKNLKFTESSKKLNINWNKEEHKEIKQIKQIKHPMIHEEYNYEYPRQKKEQHQCRKLSSNKISLNFNNQRVLESRMNIQAKQCQKSRSVSKSQKKFTSTASTKTFINSNCAQKMGQKSRINSSCMYAESKPITGVKIKKILTQRNDQQQTIQIDSTSKKPSCVADHDLKLGVGILQKKMSGGAHKQNLYMNASVRNKQNCLQFKQKIGFGHGLISSSNLDNKKFIKHGQQIKNVQPPQISHRFLQRKDCKK